MTLSFDKQQLWLFLSTRLHWNLGRVPSSVNKKKWVLLTELQISSSVFFTAFCKDGSLSQFCQGSAETVSHSCYDSIKMPELLMQIIFIVNCMCSIHSQSQIILRVQDWSIQGYHSAKEMSKKKRAVISRFKSECTVNDFLSLPVIIPWLIWYSGPWFYLFLHGEYKGSCSIWPEETFKDIKGSKI